MKQHDEQHRLRTCLWIITALERRGRLTLKDLNALWVENPLSHGQEIIVRTFYNYRSAIQDLFGIIISYNAATKEYFIDYNQNNSTTEWLVSSFSVGELIRQNDSVQDRILLEKVPSGQTHLASIIEAMSNNDVIEITYQRFVSEESHLIKIEPYCVKIFRQRWYVIGVNIERNRLQTYALDRIGNVLITGNKFEINRDFNAEDYFRNSFGIFVRENVLPERVIIKADSTESKYLRTLPLHHSQKETAKGKDFSLFELNLDITEDFIMELRSYGPLLEIVEPAFLRERLKQDAEKLTELYK